MGPMVEQMAGLMTLRMANAELIPYNINRYSQDLKMHFENAVKKINSYDKNFQGFQATNSAIKSLDETSIILESKLQSYLEGGKISRKNLKKLNEQLIALEKSFISDKGMYFGAWYKSIYASSDPFSGYGAWILPGLEYEIALKSSERLKEWDSRNSDANNSLESKMKNLIKEIN